MSKTKEQHLKLAHKHLQNATASMWEAAHSPPFHDKERLLTIQSILVAAGSVEQFGKMFLLKLQGEVDKLYKIVS